MKTNDIIKNLNHNSKIANAELSIGILENKIDPWTVAYLTPAELFPSNWKELIEKREFIDFKMKNMATTDRFECKKCHERKCRVAQAQTRSCDEPMTTFITCTICGYTIKF